MQTAESPNTLFDRRRTPALSVAIPLTTLAVFVADVLTPLGLTVWVIYLVPLVLCLFVWQPRVPIATATALTLLMGLGLALSPTGMSRDVALANRVLGAATVWAIAFVAWQFIRNRLVLQRQEWLQTGQTRLSQVMGGDQRLEVLGENILRFLAEYLHAHAGAMFVEDGGTFRRVATYAVPAASPMPERFTPGDGLLGQSAKDGRSFVVSDLPHGYLSFGSALGRDTPRHLLVAPTKLDGSVNAVLELGFVHRIYDFDTELLERVSEAIAVAVQSSKFRTRLQELLQETQRQAEELQAQSEELRVNNEELEEQGRALQASQARLQAQHVELEQTNAQLEEQAQLLEVQRDELARAQGDLQQRASDLEQASRYKSEFLANMSHELRTPLNAALIMAKLLADNPQRNLTEEQVTYAQTISSSGNDLLTLINDILDLSKIEAGRVEVQVERVPLTRLAENLERTFRAMATAKGLRLEVHLARDAPDTVETDAQRLEQVLKNLVSNALKFTEQGEVAVEVRGTTDGVEIAVRDTGIGIPEDQQDAIFEAFRQADGTTNRKYGGTGLGLSISRELVRLLGGTLRLRSELGRGSTFTVTLPRRYDPKLVAGSSSAYGAGSSSAYGAGSSSAYGAGSSSACGAGPSAPMAGGAPASPAAAHGERHQALSAPRPPIPRRLEDDRERLTGDSRTLLIVEDDESFARVLSDLAHELKFQCLIATSAEEALALAPQYSPSAVLLDVGLPDHSGLSVLDRLKRDARTRHIPVHVVSGGDYAHAALSMGAVGYMLKPVDREDLLHAFEQLETRFTQKLRRVLIVEDDPAQLESIRALLASADIETVGARSANEGLERLGSDTFDCMVLDLSLPDRSGFSLLETLSQEDTYSFPPVIVYTGKDLSQADEQRLRRYSKSIIIKGAKSPERLLDEVTLFLHHVMSELPPKQQQMLQKARSREAALEGKRILVVEDDVRNVFALTSILEPRGAKVAIARNGREALEALEKSSDPGSPVDLVLMDVMMPEMDGLTAMREIRKRPDWKKLPIIALTAKAMKHDQRECLEAGANDYMAKPLDVEKLLSLVRVWMRR